jgi:hypothetical protein
MMEGANKTVITEEEYEQFATDLKCSSTTKDVIGNLIERRENLLKGGVNCIPLPFSRFRSEIPGIEQGQYVLVTANQKCGKTNLADYVYVFHVLDYCFEHRSSCSAHIIYFALEESVQKVIERYMSYLLYKLDGLRLAPTDLRSTSTDYPVPQEALDLLQSERYQERLRFFEECVQFETEDTNPTGILRVCEVYAKKVGKYTSHKIKSNSLFSDKEVEIFDSYVQDDKNHYKIVIIDHIGLVDREQGFRTKDAVDKMSEYFVKYLRNRYNYTCVAIQQQASEAEGLEAIKQKKMVPTASYLSDSKYTARDCDLAVGLFDPSKFGLPSWLGYKIQDTDGIGLRNYGRFLYVIANRNGDMGGICPLFFDGAVCNFEELPKPEDINAITQYYNKAKNIRSYRQQKKLATLTLSNFIKKQFNGKNNFDLR